MISLTFGEQVKIILSRKGMTIKELAELVEHKTGKKMSRQNLTQRLNRDNFQEQDMRLIADILGCSFQLSILASAEAVERASTIEEVRPTEEELYSLEARKERRKAKGESRETKEESRAEVERDITVGELVEMIENPLPNTTVEDSRSAHEPAWEEKLKPAVQEAVSEEEPKEAEAQQSEQIQMSDVIEEEVSVEPYGASLDMPGEAEREAEAEPQEETEKRMEGRTEPKFTIEAVKDAPQQQTVREEDQRGSKFRKIANILSGPDRGEEKAARRGEGFEPIKKRSDEEEDMVQGDVNPYTGHEYQTNSVRMHPRRIGYVQVYDRKEHKWTDMTEWAFLGVEERKKVMLGKDYEPPIYLD